MRETELGFSEQLLHESLGLSWVITGTWCKVFSVNLQEGELGFRGACAVFPSLSMY